MSKDTPGKPLEEYGQDYYETYGQKYYATGLGPIPYERSAHWVNFFAITADQLIRSLQPRRVLDAGCAMGLLVEAFWDRGIHCEGVDISEYAISKVRPDIREYCTVGSLADALPGRFDLVTCIEVLEHLPSNLAKPAIANLCAAADTILFSSTPSDFEEATHQNVRPPIYWLALFAEFDFWPDARFDASFLTSHAMLVKKGFPPSDDFLRLYSEYIRYKTAFDGRVADVQGMERELAELRGKFEEAKREQQLEVEKRKLEVEEQLLAVENQQLEVANQLKEQIKEVEFRLCSALAERGRLLAEIQRLELIRTDRDNIADHSQVLTKEVHRLSGEVHRLSGEAHRLDTERAAIGTTLHQVLSSRAWRMAEKFRRPLRKLRSDWPRAYSIIRFLAGKRSKGVKVVIGKQPAMTEAPVSDRVILKLSPRQPVIEDAYQRWIHEREPSSERLAAQRSSVESAQGPRLSVIIPVHQTDHSMLRECIQSVLDQTYGCWELCIAITPGGDPQNHRFLLELEKADDRVHVVAVTQNLGISHNSNSALDLARGDFLVLLDHDDTLAPFALFEVASSLLIRPDTDIIYSDHDYLDPDSGTRRDPLFKPAWSPAIMFSSNYITHLTVIRRSLLDQIGRFNTATDGAQDWDLFLRATERTSRISHIPQILYHWRMHAGSTARNDSAKNYAAEAQLLALRGHMERTGINAQPEVMPNGLLHVRFNQPPTGMISIIIPTKDRLDLLSRCISSLLTITEHANFEILIVDNGSIESATKTYFESLEKDQRIRILWHPGPFNYSTVNNRAARESKGEFLLFLNNDVEITNPDWLNELVAWAALAPIGVVGAKLLRKSGTIQHAGIVVGLSGFAGHPFADMAALTFGMAGSTGWYRNFLAVTGACMMMRRQVFEELAGFDENFILCGSDVEICLNAYKHGYQIVCNPFAELIHYEQQTRGLDVPNEDFAESFKHYRRWLNDGDPYWNPNLSMWESQPAFRSSKEEPSLGFAERHVQSVRAQLAAAPAHAVTEEDQLVGWFDCSEEQFQRLHQQAAVSATIGYRAPKRILWFIPAFHYPFYGGAHTILRFADSWGSVYGVESLFAICGSEDPKAMLGRIRQVYPGMKAANLFVLNSMYDAADLPTVDADICTLWTTAYYALHHENVDRRFYLIQDYEPAFYRAGSASALVESTYRMGLYGIANTISLKKMYESEYDGKAVYFKQCIVDSIFYAPPARSESDRTRPWQVVFYGRPGNPRNAFEIVKRAMTMLKERMGTQVRIVSAGEHWKPADYGLQGIVENLGVLAYEDSARLYRESDVGVAMMLTRHPSYIPLEMMASGCLAVTNINSWTAWLLKDGENCLLAHATPTSMADTVERALIDVRLREKIRTNALAYVRSDYLDWSVQADKIYNYLCDPEAGIELEKRNAVAGRNGDPSLAASKSATPGPVEPGAREAKPVEAPAAAPLE